MIGILNDATQRHSQHRSLAEHGDALLKRLKEIGDDLQILYGFSPEPKVLVGTHHLNMGHETVNAITTAQLEHERAQVVAEFNARFAPPPQKPALRVVRDDPE
jgi:hypothetical protein